MKIACLFATAALLVSGAALPACKSSQPTSGGGTATFHPITGELTMTVESGLDRTYAAAQAALETLQFRSTGTSKDALTGILNAKTADGASVKVTVEKRTENVTDVTIGVGPFGKEATARLVGDEIRKKL